MKLSRVQKRSKHVLGGAHRATVGAAIASLGNGWWTTADLASAVGDGIPWSSVNKELIMLVDEGLVVRTERRRDNGRLQYRVVPVLGFWDAMTSLAQEKLPLDPRRASGLQLVTEDAHGDAETTTRSG
jgi:hypothetical protein